MQHEINTVRQINTEKSMFSKQLKKGISIIIPFFNAESTLLETAMSLINQKKDDTFQFEVLLIDNNSTDGGTKIAQSLETVYPDIFRYIYYKEPGVSNARNLGLRLASMEYIMFLDADDMYSRTALNDVYKFFKKNEKIIDIVFLPRFFMYVDENGNKTFKPHRRNKLFKKTGVFVESENKYELYFTSPNIAIKNNNLHQFDIDVPYGEDMLFISEILGDVDKVGFVSTAHYNYRFSSWSTVNKYESPVYAADLILDNMEKQFLPYTEKKESVPKLIQSMALNELAWRYESLGNKLFPFHFEKERWIEWKTRLRNLLRLIDNDIILNYSSIDRFHRYSILMMKEENTKVAIFDHIDFRQNGIQIYKEQNFETIISDMKVVDNKLVVSAYLKMKLGELVKVTPCVSINGTEFELSYWTSVSGRYRKRDISNFFPAYKAEINLNEIFPNKDTEIYFFYKIGDKKFNIKQYYNVKNRVFNINNKVIRIHGTDGIIAETTINDVRITWLENGKFVLSRLTDEESEVAFEIKTQNAPLKIQKLRYLFRNMPILDKQQKVWLYVDNFNTVDNAFYQYQNDYMKNDGIKRYYIYKRDFLYLGRYISDHHIDMSNMNFVKYGSSEHRELMLRTEYILAAYNEYFATVVPFDSGELLALSDVLKFKYIYLQHGVLHAKAPQTYDAERTYFDKVVISSDYERKIFTKELHYDDESLLQVGMSRFDMPHSNKRVNRILFAPSWRHTFVGDLNTFDENGNRTINIDQFIHSQYYESLAEIMQSKELEKFLEKKNLDLDIKLHPIFSGAMDILKPLVSGKKRIHLLAEQTIDAVNYSIFVTDFSSYLFDAVANKMPIVYYELDRDEFLAGNHNYRELYLGFDFGDVVNSIVSFIGSLKKIIKENYSVEPKYYNKMESFYNYPLHARDGLYNALKLMEGKTYGKQ